MTRLDTPVPVPTTRTALAAPSSADFPSARAPALPTYRAEVIGHAGRGNYGYGPDTAFVALPAGLSQ